MNTITLTLTDEQFKALQSGQSITIEPPKPETKKWEPKGGRYNLTSELLVKNYMSSVTRKHAGMEYETVIQAEHAAKQLRSYARQLAWLAENDDGWVADWGTDTQAKYCVYYSNTFEKYESTNNCRLNYLNTIYMSKSNAEKLCELLNSGIV